ncbi:MAG: ABC transporter [Actinobacteria bacterium HGW-Actinobacteria-4]|nr:MAG: ABC transporter [Actinobacteria bacterium HGW-Actinobacteria-4]
MTTITTQGLRVTYGEVVALDDISLTVEPGLTVLVGVNGSGKSSLLGAISGSVRPSAGTVMVDGQPASQARARGAVAYVPQLDVIDRDFPVTVHTVVEMGRYASRASRVEDRAAIAQAIDRVGLSGLERRQIGELSGGQRRRVLLARALAQQAEVLILDEPDAGIDSGARQTFYALLRSFIDEGRTVLMATHDLASVPDLADHAVVLHQRVIASGKPRDVLTPEVLAQAFGMKP